MTAKSRTIKLYHIIITTVQAHNMFARVKSFTKRSVKHNVIIIIITI